MTKVSEPRPLDIMAGVLPSTDGTSLISRHLRSASKMRSVNGLPAKIGGWESQDFDRDDTISGKARSLYSCILSGTALSLIGTHTRFYSIYGSTLTNITPLKTSSTAAAASLATLYGTLANNPLTTTNGSKTVTIADASGARLRAGDTVTLSGASTTNGIPDTDINAAQVVRSVAANGLSWTFIVATAASSSGTGGGASVVRATGIIQVTKASHGLTDGDRNKLSGAADTGGITAAQINVEHIIRVTASSTYDVMTAGTATSSVTGGGGAGVVYYPQIDAGNENDQAGQGYGMGRYGVGLYGTALQSTSDLELSRIWYTDSFGTNTITTPGEQTGLYEWNGDTTAAPVLVSGAPTAINYAFVSDSIIVTFGASAVQNRIKTSDQGDRTNWTSSSTNQVFVDDIEGAGRLLSHVHVNGVNLIFTKNQTYTFRKIPRDSGVWEIKLKDPGIGIIAPLARVVVNGIAYWMGQNNFYMWRGGNIEVIPSNSSKQSTILRYVFDNINKAQSSKFHAWYNERYNEVWFHYCSSTASEPDRIARLCLQDFSWWPDTMNRTCSEGPAVTLDYPRLIDSSGVLYQHEIGKNDDGAAMSWSFTTPDSVSGKNNGFLTAIYPDSVQDGSITVAVAARRYPQSASTTFSNSFTVTSTTELVPCSSMGRFWNYTISGSTIDQDFLMGVWFEELQEGPRV